MKRTISDIFPIIDEKVAEARKRASKDGQPIQCGPDCPSCCYLLPAVTWEEAELLADWVRSQPNPRRSRLVRRIAARAEEMRKLAEERAGWRIFSRPTRTNKDIPDSLCDEYFRRTRGCAFLIRGRCAAYAVRPTVCRLHLVSSHPRGCSRRGKMPYEVDVPDAVEKVQQTMLGRARRYAKDGRWGQLAVMVEAALIRSGAETNGIRGRPAAVNTKRSARARAYASP